MDGFPPPYDNTSMPNPSSKKRRPVDFNQLAKSIVDEATAERPAPGEPASLQAAPPPDGKLPAAVELGRLGGLKGGRARAESLTPERRSEIAKAAAAKRWAVKVDRAPE